MTPEQTKQRREWFDRNRRAMVAFEGGVAIQSSSMSDVFVDSFDPRWIMSLEYRVKPVPKVRPYEKGELIKLVGTPVKTSFGDVTLITGVDSVVRLGQTCAASPQSFLENYTHLDGSPSGITEPC